MKTHISFRLRKHLDADLISHNIEEDELTELCRNGLRLMLGIRTTRQVEVKEKPLLVPPQSEGIRLTIPPAPASEPRQKTIQPRPAIFLPQQQAKTN